MPFYRYIVWAEQSFINAGESGFSTLLKRCLRKFKDEPRYYNDVRFLSTWIKAVSYCFSYINMQVHLILQAQ